MKEYVLENYAWYDDITNEIRKDYKRPFCTTATGMKDLKETAGAFGKSIMIWREIEREEGKGKTVKTIYTIKINGKIHTTHDKRYAIKLAIKKNGKNKQRR